MIVVADLPQDEIELTAIRASGPGGQHVNKVATAIHLRFDIRRSSLPESVKGGLLKLRDRRITVDGCVVIKAQNARSQEKNRIDALARFDELLAKAQQTRKARRATRPTRASVRRRLDGKKQKGGVKQLRRRPDY